MESRRPESVVFVKLTKGETEKPDRDILEELPFARVPVSVSDEVQKHKWSLKRASLLKVNSKRYAQGWVDGKRVSLHRFVWEHMMKSQNQTEAQAKKRIKLKDGDGLNCEESNMQAISMAKKQHVSVTKGIRRMANGTFNARCNGKHAGYFKTLAEAQRKYDAIKAQSSKNLVD